ncbi:MAG: LptF/LptG family permease [Roseibacillus sp.]
MRIADRYIGWQVLYGTIFGVTLLTVVLILGQIFKQIRPLLVEQAVPLDLIGRFILLILPFSLMFTLPWGFLASTLLSFGRLSGNNELLGLRMAGVSLTRVALPALVVGAALSGLCSWLTGTAAPKAKLESRSLLYEAVKADPRALLDPGVIQSRFDNKRVYVESRDEDGVLHGIHIYEFSDDSRDAKPIGYLYAALVDLYVEAEKKQLRLKLADTYLERTEEGKAPDILQASELEPVLIDFSGTRTKKYKPSDVTNSRIPGEIRQSKKREVDMRTELEEKSDLTDERIAELEYTHWKEQRWQKNLRIELHKRRSISMACLAFAIIGIPLGISARRRETSNGLLLSLLVAAGYFGILIFAQQFEKAPLPAVIAVLWLPNVLCLFLGIWLFRRASFR